MCHTNHVSVILDLRQHNSRERADQHLYLFISNMLNMLMHMADDF